MKGWLRHVGESAGLPGPEAVIRSSLREQLCMAAIFDDAPLIEHEDAIEACDG